jgi:hypothetical protein
MSQPKRTGSLEIAEDLSFQEKEWTVERVGWILMAGVVMLALVGLFGEGPVSSAIQSSQEGFQISYERFDRQMKSSQISLQLPAEAVQEGQIKFWIDRQYLEGVQIEDISPQPESVEVSGKRLVYTVQVTGPGQPVTVKLDVRLQKSGLVEGQAGLEGGDPVSFSQFVFP